MREAAEALRLTADDLTSLGVADKTIPEPMGGAHRDVDTTISSVRDAIAGMLSELNGIDGKKLVQERREKFLKIGSKGLAA